MAVLAAGCQEPNPRSCIDGTCTDPSLPFCDVDGALAGEPQTCIAVTCTPGELAACRGDQAVTCNTEGTSYDLIQCPKGCDAVGGCRVCDPGQTVCANGKVQTCDASGTVTESEDCPLGCFEDESRCREIDPSNNLGMYLDMVEDPPDLTLANGQIDTLNGTVLENGAEVSVPTFLVSAPTNGAEVRVLVVRNLELGQVSFRRDAGPFAGPALAILATGAVTITGPVRGFPGAGSVSFAGCVGGDGRTEESGGQLLYTGGGGGGHATAGSRGGHVLERYPGGDGGAPHGTESLTPLRGGCRGGGGLGGAALQISSRHSIRIDGVLDVRGETPEQLGGGGAGGAVLLEAPALSLGTSARLIATGGGGGAGLPGDPQLAPVTDDGSPNLGVSCVPATAYCTRGGDGAAAGIPATAGGDSSCCGGPTYYGAGGGGGGLGRIRFNTPDRTYTRANTAVEAGATTIGTLSTR